MQSLLLKYMTELSGTSPPQINLEEAKMCIKIGVQLDSFQEAWELSFNGTHTLGKKHKAWIL